MAYNYYTAIARYVTVTLLNFDKQWNSRRTGVESKSNVVVTTGLPF